MKKASYNTTANSNFINSSSWIVFTLILKIILELDLRNSRLLELSKCFISDKSIGFSILDYAELISVADEGTVVTSNLRS